MTIDYYNTNADVFFENTVNADMAVQYDFFTKYVKPGTSILDCGCGSGRDTLYFLKKGYDVKAIDASEELCKKASELTGISVECKRFEDIYDQDKYDGIWACASLLHIPSDKLPGVFWRLKLALKPKGYLYVSFKYGDYEGERNGRYFTDLTEDMLLSLIGRINGLIIKKTFISKDSRPEREEEWLNAIMIRTL